MNVNDILLLIKAGYTKEEINNMVSVKDVASKSELEPEVSVDSKAESEVVEVPEVTLDDTKSEIPELSQKEDRLSKLERNINIIAAAVQNANRRDNYRLANIISPDDAAINVMTDMLNIPKNNKEVKNDD